MPSIKFEYINVFNEYELKRIFGFLREINDDFVPPLDQKVNLEQYASKLLKNAVVYVAVEGHKIVGLIAFYCNNLGKKEAYIPILGVHKNHRAQGIGGNLLKNAIKHMKSKGFLEVRLETWENSSALNLYLKNGFEIEDIIKDRPGDIRSVKMKLRLYK